MEIYLRAILLGIVQGATEFLPVSSSGHLAIFGKYLDVGAAGFILAVALHMATLLAVLVYFRRKIIVVFTSLRGLMLIIAATIPTAIIGLALKKTVEAMFASDIKFVFASLGLTGVMLFAASLKKVEKIFPQQPSDAASHLPQKSGTFWEHVTPLRAIIIGISQGIAVIPGISRSGATISTAIFSGIPPEEAAEFSFVASIPAVAGAGILLELKDILSSGNGGFSFGGMPSGAVLLSLGAAFIVGIIAIKFFISILGSSTFSHNNNNNKKKSGGLRFFAYYLWAVSVAGLVLLSL